MTLAHFPFLMTLAHLPASQALKLSACQTPQLEDSKSDSDRLGYNKSVGVLRTLFIGAKPWNMDELWV